MRFTGRRKRGRCPSHYGHFKPGVLLIRCAVRYPRFLTLSDQIHFGMLKLHYSLITYYPFVMGTYSVSSIHPDRFYTGLYSDRSMRNRIPLSFEQLSFHMLSLLCLVPTFPYILYCFRRSLNIAPFWSHARIGQHHMIHITSTSTVAQWQHQQNRSW
jgi:hypothetical protein